MGTKWVQASRLDLSVALELAGALLIAFSLLLPILRRGSRLAARGYLIPRGGATLDNMLEPAYPAVGASFLMSGFVTQLLGYVVEFKRDSPVAAAVKIALLAALGGAFLAT